MEVIRYATRMHEYNETRLHYFFMSAIKFLKLATFLISGGILDNINVLSNHSVPSSLECGQYCLKHKTCQGFNYKSAMMTYEDDDINCQLSKQSNTNQNKVNDGEWIYHKAIHVASQVRIIRICRGIEHARSQASGDLCLYTVY